MLTDQDLIISRSFLILIGSFILFSVVGVIHPHDHAKYKRYRLAENYELPKGARHLQQFK